MTKLLNAIRRRLADAPHVEPAPHFHQGTTLQTPEVCFEGACDRPHLATR